jgi:hypothetical protein
MAFDLVESDFIFPHMGAPHLTFIKKYYIILKKTFFKTARGLYPHSMLPVRMSERALPQKSQSSPCSFVFTKADFYQLYQSKSSSNECFTVPLKNVAQNACRIFF